MRGGADPGELDWTARLAARLKGTRWRLADGRDPEVEEKTGGWRRLRGGIGETGQARV